jgi:peptide chain release factor subunit 1
MITYADVEDLLDFQSKDQPTISFYLNTDRSRFNLDQQQLIARNLLRDGRRTVESGSWTDAVRNNLLGDLKKIETTVNKLLEPTFQPRGLAIFSCEKAGLWRVFHLPRPVPSALIMEYSPHIRPLTLILDEYHRFAVLLLDRKNAELYDVYIGDIVKVENAFLAMGPEAPPPHPGAVDHVGAFDRGISKHKDEEEMFRHFRHTADVIFHQFHRRHFEYLVLGGQQTILSQFENFLHPSLQEKLVARFPAEPGRMKPNKILEEVGAIERRVEAETEKRLIRQLVDTAGSRGLAVLGLEPVLKALGIGAVHMLFVEEGWQVPGVVCRKCNYLALQGDLCPSCSGTVTATSDIVDDAIEVALKTGSMIEHVNPSTGIGEYGHIGAILRYRVAS